MEPDFELVLADAALHIHLERPRRVEPRLHRLVENAEAAAPGAFGLIERDVRAFHQLGRIRAVIGIESDSDAGGQRYDGAVDFNRTGDRVDDAAGEIADVSAFMVAAIGEHDEFVAAEPRDDVAPPRRVAQSRRAFDDDRVADRVPLGVVDFLEAIEVNGEEGEAARRFFRRAAQGGRQRVVERIAIEQPGQRVVAREVAVVLVGAVMRDDPGVTRSSEHEGADAHADEQRREISAMGDR